MDVHRMGHLELEVVEEATVARRTMAADSQGEDHQDEDPS